MTAGELAEEVRRLCALLDDGLAFQRRVVQEHSVNEDVYRVARARAFLEASGTVGDRNAHADLATSTQRRAAHLSAGMMQAGLEAIRSRRAQISAVQSIAGAYKAEAEFGRTAPQTTP